MPMASARPKRVRLLIENPKACITAKVPIKETGIARMGISAARHDWRKMIITSTTSSMASRMVVNTASMERSMNCVGS